jgi:hypothetical protein
MNLIALSKGKSILKGDGMVTGNVQRSEVAAAQHVSFLTGYLQGQPLLKKILHNL